MISFNTLSIYCIKGKIEVPRNKWSKKLTKLNAYDDVEWQKLCAEHKLRTLRTNEMDLFSEKHKCAIDKTIKKGEKICVNEAELAKQMAATYMQHESKNKP